MFRHVLRPRLLTTRLYASEAEAAAGGKLRLSIVLPHQTILRNAEVLQVNVPSTAGDMGILPDHVPSIEQLRPGVVEVVTAEGSKKYFASGGFCIVNSDSTVNINAVEAFTLDEFAPELVNSNLAAAQRNFASAAAEKEKEEAKIEVEVLEALQNALKG